MPLIGGNKYSCEPCIRGHRATHCNHTDRILIEVRKPGRPLDRCAHTISSCTCSRHLQNSTVLEVKIQERSTSPATLESNPRSSSTKRGKKTDEERVETKTLLISKEQPFARELRLSSIASSSTSPSPSSEEDDEDEEPPRSSSARATVKREEEKKSKKNKVFKRHRLGDGTKSTTSSRKKPKQAPKSPLFTTTPMIMSLNLPPTDMMDVDVEPPALSPSISESGSERTLAAFAEPVDEIVVLSHARPEWVDEKKIAEPVTTFRSISISELLT